MNYAIEKNLCLIAANLGGKDEFLDGFL